MPILNQKGCTPTGACHSTTQAPNLTSFAALADKYKMPPGDANILVNHVAAGAPHGAGTWFSTTEMDTVAKWINNK